MRIFLLLLCLSLAPPVSAMHIAVLEGSGWQARDLRLQLDLAEADAQGVIELAAVDLPEPLGRIEKLRLTCQPLVFERQRIACLDAPLTAQWALLDKNEARASFEYIAASGELRLSLKQLAALGGRLSMHYQLKAEGWQLEGELNRLQASAIAPLLKATGQVLSADAGTVSGQIKAWGNEEQLNIDYKASIAELSAYDEAGELASDKLSLSLNGVAAPYREGWRSRLQLVLQSGQLYVNPIFMDLAERPLNLFSRVHYYPKALLFDELQLDHKDTLQLQAQGSFALGDDGGLRELSVQALNANMATAYPIYLQPFLLDSGLGELETLGRVEGEMQMRQGSLHSLLLTISDVTAHDKKQRYSIDQARGELHWHAKPEQMRLSQLQWRSGSAYQLPFGAGDLRWQAAAEAVQLQQAFSLPLVGGALKVNRFSAAGLGKDAMTLQFDGALEQLKLSELTRALGWPEFGGSLSGRLPDLSYSDGSFTVGGTLAAEVFDGAVQVKGLRVDNPFGRLPRLAADIEMRNIDLALATSAFQFGAIEGRLHGDVKGLRLLNWQPAAFDARFYTPPGDKSRQRISQRAIENISSIGGAGAGAVLSRGFMQFFENFAYDRLGISCRLANTVCLMGGIEDAPDKGGYYLVKGKLLPRIDVIGYANEVSWPALVEQLRGIAAGEGPVVK